MGDMVGMRPVGPEGPPPPITTISIVGLGLLVGFPCCLIELVGSSVGLNVIGVFVGISLGDAVGGVVGFTDGFVVGVLDGAGVGDNEMVGASVREWK